MATQTPNLGLIKPDGGEQYDIGVFNTNADKIDGILNSPAFTGTPTVPPKTSAAINDGMLIATEAQVYQAAAGGAAVVIGTYVGNGTRDRTITLGFTPKAVLLSGTASNGRGQQLWNAGGPVPTVLAIQGVPASDDKDNPATLRIETNGFGVSYVSGSSGAPLSNQSGSTYRYIAIK